MARNRPFKVGDKCYVYDNFQDEYVRGEIIGTTHDDGDWIVSIKGIRHIIAEYVFSSRKAGWLHDLKDAALSLNMNIKDYNRISAKLGKSKMSLKEE